MKVKELKELLDKLISEGSGERDVVIPIYDEEKKEYAACFNSIQKIYKMKTLADINGDGPSYEDVLAIEPEIRYMPVMPM